MTTRLPLIVGLLLVCLLPGLPPLHGAPVAQANAKDGAAMVWVPAGPFTMGTSQADIARQLQKHPDWNGEWFTLETPQHTVVLDGYWVYQYEVTVEQYQKFSKATKRKMPAQPKWSGPKFPVVNVTWDDASAYAEWAGARLPSEAEWEKAARGTDGRIFPWGNTWEEVKCNNWSDKNPAAGGYHGGQAAPVGSYPDGASPYGAEDMAGNVWEWCDDWFDPAYYKHSPAKNPHGPDAAEMRVLRGGSWGSTSKSVRATFRNAEAPDLTYHDDGGFRCVVDKPGPKV